MISNILRVMLINGIIKMAEKQRLSKNDTKVKCKDKNIPENVKTLEKYKDKSRCQHLKHQMQCKK